ncbi:squalene/phytoene synthase family protein [Micromonospora sp. NBC_01699]|uniref:squalene/phytoene synthase family protein n=1 Tax=Micromonospora sp. NBC_01699 TaxID=2975984 RepID=UPI002E2A1B88|nr:squalene/phytoene synthase family protein [Micromonospora sp. NBC_01699]
MLELTGNVSSQPPGDPAARPSGDPSALRRIPDTALSGENFPVALRILPGTIRRHLLALYGYARYVDDLGDEPVGDQPAPVRGRESARGGEPGRGRGPAYGREPARDPVSEPPRDPGSQPPRDPNSPPARDPGSPPARDPGSLPPQDPTSPPARDPATGHRSAGHYDTPAGHYDTPAGHYDTPAGHYDTPAGHYDTPAGHYDTPAARSAALHRFEDELRAMYDGRPPTHPVLVALAPTVADRRLPIEPLRRLIAANQRDQVVHRYDTYDDLVDYCHLSADPVGELVLHVFEAQSARRIALSNRICTALQVVEHLQDVAEDYRRGRIYLPATDLDQYGVAPDDLAAPYASDGLRAVIRLQAVRAGAALDAGAPLVGALHGWARLAVAGYLAGGRAALAALARSDHDPLSRVPRPTRAGTAGQWLKTLIARPG